MKQFLAPAAALLAGLTFLAPAHGDEPTPAERGKAHLLGQVYNPPAVPLDAWGNLWKQWGLAEKPSDVEFARMMRERYGFHAAPYPNKGYPMGLREGKWLLGKGIAHDCMFCHGGSILGKSYVGLGNSTLDIQSAFRRFEQGDGPDGQDAVHVLQRPRHQRGRRHSPSSCSFREPDLKVRSAALDLDLHDDLCEDTPAWWLLKKKKTMYHTGGGDRAFGALDHAVHDVSAQLAPRV